MHFTSDASAIATEPIKVRTPQRKAKYHDKARFKLKKLKQIAFNEYGCTSTAQIKRYLKFLKTRLDLRLTAAWQALVFELRNRILAIKEILDSQDQAGPSFKVGDSVFWKNAPLYLHCWWGPLKIMSIANEKAQLELWDGKPVPLRELQAA